jgi:hypothetical protein
VRVRVRARIEDFHSYSHFYSNPPPELGKGAVPQTREERVRVRVITFEVGGLIIGDIAKPDIGVELHSSIMPWTEDFYTN